MQAIEDREEEASSSAIQWEEDSDTEEAQVSPQPTGVDIGYFVGEERGQRGEGNIFFREVKYL